MAINIQNLASITDISQLKVGADNQLQQRSGIGTFFLKIGDAFRNLSQAGRASIAQRNDSILNAMRAAVDNARETVRAEDRPMAQRLSSVFQRLQTANANRAVLSGLETAITRLQTQASAVKHGLAGDPRFTAMPSLSQQLLCSALNSIDAGREPDKASAKERIKNDFFGVRPAGYNIAEGLRQFGEGLVDGFLNPKQQKEVHENGIHKSFILDTRRHSVSSFNGRAVPTVDDPAIPGTNQDERKDNLAALCVRELRTIVGEEHQNLMPFISMMASQAGLDSALTYLPFMSGLSEPADAHLAGAGIAPVYGSATHDCTISREGDTLSISITFSQGYASMDVAASAAGLFCKGGLTMNIDLAAPPRPATVNGRDVLIPQFTLNNADVRFETPAAD
ncbi:MAG: hypothetical protein IJC28_02255 [Mailhella sp.]|nr:hypothetical protein [Mailhella sp.]MBQ3172469.1 hypothetical protein [Mailhella sp.]MBQ4325723.1 hypothetical protein [Mailhella sp.]